MRYVDAMGQELPFSVETLANAPHPLIAVERRENGRLCAATAGLRIDVSPEQLWKVLADLPNYHKRVPMMSRVAVADRRIAVDLKFRMSLFSVGFSFVADAILDEGRSIELRYVSGEPRDLAIRFDLQPIGDGKSSALQTRIGFDVDSLGWLVKVFLRHHPEIEYGIFPGCALALVDTMRKAATGKL